ncbi:unnamed protein product [Triticum turgidum subsp. durum]|uniref:Protein kinase domain-containing protein n=1 Tax=Triticum turgidum subsp. durum TaxID=4567 RepID=A0A9R1QK02_TRITD|nr:unnamed protein product [Triticum turgidum subsp. durum]
MPGKPCTLTILLLAASALAAAAAAESANIAVYWGQNATEGTLRDTCGTGLYAYVNLAFLSIFGAGRAPVLNLADHCDPPSGTCASLAADIASCQSAGVKVLLSMGGGALGRSYDKDSGFSVKLQSNLQNRNKNTGNGASSDYKRRIYIIVGVIGGIFLLLLLLTTCFICHKKYRGLSPPVEGSTTPPSKEPSEPKLGAHHPKRYTYSEVERMTKTFAHRLGQGSHGDVYRGNLRDARQITVKVLKNCKGSSKDFVKEVESIGAISHANVAPLLGFCLQGPTRALIYEYMPNGSLESYALSSDDSVDENYSLWLYWEKLFDIAIGVARGLDHLHGDESANGMHISIKPRNILLDQELCPKISDVGVANLCETSTRGVRERDDYDAPEVVSRRFGPVTSKSDVYSYGVMVLEMVRAKRHVKVGADTTSKYFAQWLYEHLDEFCNSVSDVNGDTRELVRKMIIVGLWCSQTAPASRPSMSAVVEMLERSSAELELPRRTS